MHPTLYCNFVFGPKILFDSLDPRQDGGTRPRVENGQCVWTCVSERKLFPAFRICLPTPAKEKVSRQNVTR